MPDETVVDAPVDASVAAPVADTSTPAPVETPAPVADGAPTETDPALSALEEAMKVGFPADEPEAPAADGQAPPADDAIAPFLSISPYVKSPEHVQSAIQAASEVWDVAFGKTPASALLDGMKAGNPEGFKAVLDNLTQYIEQQTGQKFGAAPDTPPDPRDQRLAAIEQRFQQEEQARQQAIYSQQMGKAREVAVQAVTKAAKGTAFEGSEDYLLQQCAAKVGIPEKEMVEMLLQGKTEKLQAALKAVQKEEVSRLKKYNENLIKQYRTLKNAVPATKGAPAENKSSSDYPAYLPNETAAQYAARIWKQG